MGDKSSKLCFMAYLAYFYWVHWWKSTLLFFCRMGLLGHMVAMECTLHNALLVEQVQPMKFSLSPWALGPIAHITFMPHFSYSIIFDITKFTITPMCWLNITTLWMTFWSNQTSEGPTLPSTSLPSVALELKIATLAPFPSTTTDAKSKFLMAIIFLLLTDECWCWCTQST